MLSDKGAALRQTLDIAVDIDSGVGQLAGRLPGKGENRTDAAVDVDQGIALGRARTVGERVEFFLEFRETFGERLQKTGPLVKRHRAQRGSAHFSSVAEDGGEIHAGGRRLCDDLARRRVPHRDALIAAAPPGAIYIALQVHGLMSPLMRIEWFRAAVSIGRGT